MAVKHLQIYTVVEHSPNKKKKLRIFEIEYKNYDIVNYDIKL